MKKMKDFKLKGLYYNNVYDYEDQQTCPNNCEGLAYGASVAAGTYSEGLLSVPAFVLGRLVGGYAGGILGGDFGGAISGAVFDYFYY